MKTAGCTTDVELVAAMRSRRGALATVLVLFALLALAAAAPSAAHAVETRAKQITAREYYAAAIMQDDSLWTWGHMQEVSKYKMSAADGNGSGIGSYESSRYGRESEEGAWPEKIENGDNVASVVVGSHHAGFVKEDGSVWMWGSNSHGQLGNGLMGEELEPGSYVNGDGKTVYYERVDLHNTDVPQQVQGIEGRVKQLLVDECTSLAVTEDGKLYLWGCTLEGDLTCGTVENGTLTYDGHYVYSPNDRQPTPLLLMEGVEKAALAAGGADGRIAAIKKDGSLWIWGCNTRYGCGTDKKSGDTSRPTQLLEGTAFTDVQLGIWNGFALASNGDVYAWGNNGSNDTKLEYSRRYQLGMGSAEDQGVPVQVPNVHNVVEMRCGTTSYARCADGSLWAWGDNTCGQLGDGTFTSWGTAGRVTNDSVTTPIKVSLQKKASKILSASEANHGVVLLEDGTVWGWGGSYRALGLKTPSDANPQWLLSPTKLSVDGVVDGCSTGNNVFLVKRDGSAFASGGCEYGILGVGVGETNSFAFLRIAFDRAFGLNSSAPAPSVTPTGKVDMAESEVPAAGSVLKLGASTYKVGAGKTLTFVASSKKSGALAIPATVRTAGVTYKVTAIAAKAFKGSKVSKVVVGKNVKTIGGQAFSGCKKLTKVTIGAATKTIGAKAFYNCAKLKNVVVKSTKLTKKSVGKNAFGKIAKKAQFKVPAKKLKAYKSLFKARGAKKAKVKK